MTKEKKIDLPEGKQFDAAGFGTNAVDHLIRVPAYPEYNSKVELSGHIQAAGGEVATTMVGLSRLGLRTAYAGRLGDDAAGDIGLASLRTEGVDTAFTERVSGAATQIAFIIIDDRTGERTVIWKRDKKLAYSPAEVPLDLAQRCRVLHLTPHDAEACIVLAQAAREAGALVSIDIDNLFDGVEDLLRLVDIFVASADFPARLTGEDDVVESLKILTKRFGLRLASSTLGENGSIALYDGEVFSSSGFKVPGGCKDTTGAGDAFRSGLLYGLLSDSGIAESLRIANAVAALKCREVGARTALPRADELRDFLKKV